MHFVYFLHTHFNTLSAHKLQTVSHKAILVRMTLGICVFIRIFLTYMYMYKTVLFFYTYFIICNFDMVYGLLYLSF